MDIVILGAGKVGTALGRMLAEGHGHNIKQVYSRNYANATTLAQELKAEAVQELAAIDTQLDLYIIAVTDDAIAALAASLPRVAGLVIHTAGSVSKQVLAPSATNYGVLWPVKMIRKPMTELGSVSIVIDGNSQVAIESIEKIAKQLSDSVILADDAQRQKMHLVATVVSNFTNHLYHLAADYCEKEGVDFSVFFPIIEDTARQIQHLHPAQLQTGPAVRKNLETMEKHRQLLAQYPNLARLYVVLSESIMRAN